LLQATPAFDIAGKCKQLAAAQAHLWREADERAALESSTRGQAKALQLDLGRGSSTVSPSSMFALQCIMSSAVEKLFSRPQSLLCWCSADPRWPVQKEGQSFSNFAALQYDALRDARTAAGRPPREQLSLRRIAEGRKLAIYCTHHHIHGTHGDPSLVLE